MEISDERLYCYRLITCHWTIRELNVSGEIGRSFQSLLTDGNWLTPLNQSQVSILNAQRGCGCASKTHIIPI